MLLSLLGRLAASALLASDIGTVPAGRYGEDALLSLGSPDGYHYAQLLTVKGAEVWYKDGRKADSAPKGGLAYASKKNGKPAVEAVLAAGGAFAYARMVYDQDGRPLGLAVSIDGRRGPAYKHVILLAASPDGRHVAYAAQSSEWQIVVDGNPVAQTHSAPLALQVSDGGHAAYVLPAGNQNALYLDGKLLRPWPYDDIYFSRDWKRLAGTRASADYRYFIGVDGDKDYGPYSFRPTHILFSPDGRRFAYQADDRVIIDGKPASEKLTSISHMTFGADGRLYWFGYAKITDEAAKLFIDGSAAGSPWETPFDLAASQGGGHYAAFGTKGKRGRDFRMSSDGQESAHASMALLTESRVVFDDANEFHYLADRYDGTAVLRCESLTPVSAEDSVCMRTARGIYRRREKPADDE